MATTTAPRATFTKLRDGTWGARAYGRKPWGALEVTRRDGEVVVVRVRKVLWSGLDRDGSPAHLCRVGGPAYVPAHGCGRCGNPECDGDPRNHRP